MPQKKNQKAKPPITPKTDSERETRVLLEDVRSELKIVAEGHGLVVGRLDKIEGRLDKVEGRLDKIEGRLDKVENVLQLAKDGLQEVKGQVGQLQNQVGSILTDHEHRLKALEAK